MKAVVYTEYGSPDVLKIKEIEKPTPKTKELLIKVKATTVTATDCVFRKGKPLFSRLFTGILKPKNQILGSEFAGEIEELGPEVTNFEKGDKVYGTLPGSGAYSEFICLNEEQSTLSKIPKDSNFQEAIACCDGFLTALPFIRDKGKIQIGKKILIIGSSGSVGSAAVQLANYFGAETTGVCSTSNLELVKSIGASKVIDYTKYDIASSGEKYDIIFDAVGKASYSQVKKSLTKNGIFLEAGVTLRVFPSVLLTSIFGSKKVMIMATGLRPAKERTKDLEFIKGLMELGKVKPVIDNVFSFNQISEAHRYVDKGRKKGNVIINVDL